MAAEALQAPFLGRIFLLSLLFQCHIKSNYYYLNDRESHSKGRETVLLINVFLIISFAWYMVGQAFSRGSGHILLRSFPINKHLVFPFITPSGLIIGIILKTESSLSCKASDLSEIKKSSIPYITKLAQVSEG